MSPRPKRIRPPGADYEIRIVGDRRMPLRDFYHALLRRSWWVTFAAIAVAFLVANLIFAAVYGVVGGVAHAAPSSLWDAYIFSVQTMGTIGYGAMYPESHAANIVVVAESVTSLILTALATGMVFAKFSRSTSRVQFSRTAPIAPMNGVPTLALRMGNQRGNQIVDVRIDVVLVRTERTTEGKGFFRMLDLKLTRQHALSLSRSWTVLHEIDSSSPLFGQNPDSLQRTEAELQVMVVGLDDVTMQTVHAQHRYFTRDIVWGARHADIISESPDGNLLLDLRKFHDTDPIEPTAEFPYPGSTTP
jgi:inward rectifier potassium channel